MLVPGASPHRQLPFRGPRLRDRRVVGLTGVATAIGPFLGGWLVDAVSWRLVFLINVPLAAVALFVTLRHVPESRDPQAGRRPDFAGAGAGHRSASPASYSR